MRKRAFMCPTACDRCINRASRGGANACIKDGRLHTHVLDLLWTHYANGSTSPSPDNCFSSICTNRTLQLVRRVIKD